MTAGNLCTTIWTRRPAKTPIRWPARKRPEMMDDVADDGNNGSAGGPETGEPSTVFSALAEIIYQGTDSSEVYAAICVAATLVVTGCDHASLLVRRDGRYVTVGASDSIAVRIDDMEREAGDGPCVDAIEEET